MSKAPPKAKPPRETITSLRAKMIDDQNLISHLIQSERKTEQDRDRLKRQSAGVGTILRVATRCSMSDRSTILIACADILEANTSPYDMYDDVPF